MKYRIALYKSDEGYAASVPGLPGCWSQGLTEEDERRFPHSHHIPWHNPVNAITMGGIVQAAGLTIEQFRELL